MVDKNSQPNIVDKAFEALRRSQTPKGPSVQAMAQTLWAIHQIQEKASRTSFIERIRKMDKIVKYPLAAAIAAIALGIGIYLMTAFNGNTVVQKAIAFDDVKEQIEKAETMTVTISGKIQETGMTLQGKLYFKSPGLMRQEMTVEGDFQLPATQPAGERTIVYIENGKAKAGRISEAEYEEIFHGTGPTTQRDVTTRKDLAPASQPTKEHRRMAFVMIIDFSKGKGIRLLPDTKTAEMIPVGQRPGGVPGGFANNTLDMLKNAVAGKHEELGEKAIGGRKVKGFRVHPSAKSTVDIWVDASTGKPVMVEQGDPSREGKFTMTDFVLNPKLDDSLFDTNVPAGYMTQAERTLATLEQQLMKGLGLLAERTGGMFPKYRAPKQPLGIEAPKKIEPPQYVTHEELEKHLKQMRAREATQPASAPNVEAAEEAMVWMNIWIFESSIKRSGGEFTYVGEGVKLGDKATPILWFKAKDAKKYRVVYGDLHAEDAEVAPPRPAAQPAEKAK